MTADERPQAGAKVGPHAGAKVADRRLEAPHRRGGASPRIVERVAVAGYRALAWVLATVPPKPAAAVIGRASQLSYLAWPTKRRWSNRNFGHVLGLPPDHEQVRSMALQAYYGYGRYLVELMRLPTMTAEERAELVPDLDAVEFKRMWREAPSGGGMIFVVGHVGSNDAVAAAIARHGMPISVLADDSAFPELFELLRSQREAWGVRIIGWRNMRAIFGVLRRREMLGLLVDWGYRSDGIPVKLFGALDGPARGPGDAGREDRLAHHADHDPAPSRRDVPRDLAWGHRPHIGRPGRAPARHPGDRRRPRLDGRGGTRAVVQLQADLAGHSGRGRGPRATRDVDAVGHRRPGPGAGVRLTMAGIVSWCGSGS